VAHPREDRWHRRTVALFGGVAIAIVFALCAATFGVVRQLPALTVTTVLMFAVGFADDVLSLKPATKLIAQIALASALLLFDFRLHWLESMTLDTLLTLFWVVGLTNAFNLIDNMDGLCAGVALIVGFALLVHLLPDGAGPRAFYEARFLAILIGAVGGFLIYNVHPASVFMGDSGSLFLGFSFAAITLSSGSDSATRSDILPIVAGPVLVLLFPIFDTTLVTMSRWVSGRRLAGRARSRVAPAGGNRSVGAPRGVPLWLLAAGGGAVGVGVGSYGQQSSVRSRRRCSCSAWCSSPPTHRHPRLRRVGRADRARHSPIVVEFMQAAGRRGCSISA
jgi:UDP-GlcNAc:undecaprenyl-phosphate GlcNAc-1-phosphate transferase